jgi:hypothetical protein
MMVSHESGAQHIVLSKMDLINCNTINEYWAFGFSSFFKSFFSRMSSTQIPSIPKAKELYQCCRTEC